MMTKTSNYSLLLIIFLVSILSLWRIGDFDLQEWDESRNGVNAYEMLIHKDYVNYYYDGEIDTWNAKPPLLIWCIALSYKIFGFNEFALRFPTMLCSILLFIFCFKTIQLLGNRWLALLSCLILISSKAILGIHIGLTGDFDMMLTAFLTISVYYFILYIEYQKKYAIFLTAFFTACAFYVKGPASLIFIPGFVIYSFIRGKGLEVIKDPRIWISSALFIVIASSWIILVYSFGKTPDYTFYGSKNSIETMVLHDTFNRFTKTEFSPIKDHDNLFLLTVLDTRLNLWSYLFFIILLLGIYKLFINRKRLIFYIQDDSRRLILLSVCMILPLTVVLTFAVNQHNWYMAPTFMFFAYLTSHGIITLNKKLKYFVLLFFIILSFTFIRQMIYLNSLPDTTHQKLSENPRLQNRSVIITEMPNQNFFLYLKWLNVVIHKKDLTDNLGRYKGHLLLLNKKKILDPALPNFEPLYDFDEYFIVKIK